MIEIIQIITHFFLFIFLTSFPINILTAPKISNIFNNSYFNIIFVNSIILILIFLILSFFRLNLNYVLFTILSLYFFILIIIFPKILKPINKFINFRWGWFLIVSLEK